MKDNSRIDYGEHKRTPEQQAVVELIREKKRERKQFVAARVFSPGKRLSFSVVGVCIFSLRYVMLASVITVGVFRGDLSFKKLLCAGIVFAGMSVYGIWALGPMRFVRDLVIASICILVVLYLAMESQPLMIPSP